MAFRVQVRRDTGQRWSLNNPILLNGEMGFNINTTQFKIGDGTTPWNSLSYWNGGIGPTGPTGGAGQSGTTGPTGPTGPLAYKVYSALLSQSGIADPSAIVLQNTLNGDISWTRDAAGEYTGTLNGAFTINKTWMIPPNLTGQGNTTLVSSINQNVNYVQIATFDSSNSLDDNLLSSSCVEIRVYP